MQRNSLLKQGRTFFLRHKKFICGVFFLFLIFLGIKIKESNDISTYQKQIEESLSLASFDLGKLEADASIDSDTASQISQTYSGHILSALSDAQKIGKSEVAKKSYTTLFRSLSSQLKILQMIQRRALVVRNEMPLESMSNTNISVQAKAVESITTINQESKSPNDTKEKTQTETMLACSGCNIVLISLTTLRPDRMGIYGYEKKTTPNIDAFFKNSLIFKNTVAPTSWTTPNAVSLFTSVFPYRHNLTNRRASPFYNKSILTLSEMLKKNGYTTGAFTGGGDYNNAYSGLNRGFDFYLDEKNYKEFRMKTNISINDLEALFYAPLREFLPLGIDWLNINHQKKFFFLLQGYDTHCPLSPHEPFGSQFTKGMKSGEDHSICYLTYEDREPLYKEGKKYWKVHILGEEQGQSVEKYILQEDVDYMNALYDARVAEMDFYLNNFFEKVKSLGLEKNTVFILMSDHGEMLGEHGRFMRGGTIRGNSYKESLNFPLLIKHPNIKDPLLIDDIVQTTDIMPTILSLLGIKDPQKDIREGKPLQISNFGDTPINEYGFSGAQYERNSLIGYFGFPSSSESIRDKQWKLIKESIFEEDGFTEKDISYKLFHLSEDPGENINLYDTEKEEAEKLKSQLEQWLDHYR